MKLILIVLMAAVTRPVRTEDAVDTTEDSQVEKLKATLTGLARQTLLQQLFVEEKIRTDGDSGIKSQRGLKKGPQNYYSSTHQGDGFQAVHDHSNYVRTIGMGEVALVMNGVEFRTRHNDYQLYMPSTTSTNYDEVEKVPFPSVPEAVSKLDNITEQILELQEWFRAFKEQDYSVRDYRKHFKPILCYMEGAWTLSQGDTIEEPFASERHQIDANSWFELQELVRHSSYTGTKSRLENYAYLPTTIISVDSESGVITYSQWNYRIVCKPLEEDLPTKFLKQQEDLAHRVPRGRTTDEVFFTRGARFKIYEEDTDKFTRYTLLDKFMYTIPGKNNIPGDLKEESFGEDMYDYGAEGNVTLNTGYYHRWFRFAKDGAMGINTVARGFNDDNLWVAQTTQPNVAPVSFTSCTGRNKNKVCTVYDSRFTYAFPLEIIYLTPLLAWNPYDIEERPDERKIARAGGNNGNSEEKALNGTDKENWYLTPIEFFEGRTKEKDAADTVRGAIYVNDKSGQARRVGASGTRILLPDIADLGRIRLRYPISPIHGEGSSVWKELNALRDILNARIGALEDLRASDELAAEEARLAAKTEFQVETTFKDPPGEHYHNFFLTGAEMDLLINDKDQILEVTTSINQNHDHDLRIVYRNGGFRIRSCDDGEDNKRCWDGHPLPLIQL